MENKIIKFITTVIVLSIITLVNASEFRYSLGMYAPEPHNDKTFQHLKSLGITHILSYDCIRNKEDFAKFDRYFALAQKYNLKVVLNLRGKYIIKLPEAKRKELLEMIIAKYKDNPMLAAWYLYDEPSVKYLNTLKELYVFFKKKTPDKPVIICTARTNKWWRLVAACDIIAADNYPVKDKPYPEQRIDTITRFIQASVKAALKHDRQVISVLQSFNWKLFPHHAKKKKFDPRKTRMPVEQELRYWLFDSIIIGAEGNFFFSYWRGMEKGKNKEWFNSDFKNAAKDYLDFAKEVNFQPVSKHEFDKESKIRYGWWNKSKILVLTNSSNQTVKQSLGINLPSMVLKDKNSKNYYLTNKTLPVELAPWEVKILKINNAPKVVMRD